MLQQHEKKAVSAIKYFDTEKKTYLSDRLKASSIWKGRFRIIKMKIWQVHFKFTFPLSNESFISVMRNCAQMNSVTLRTGRNVFLIKVVLSSVLSSLRILLQSFHWKLRLVPCPPWVLHPWTTLFLHDAFLVVTSSENMLCKSPLSPLGELVEARVVSGRAAKGTDFLESMVSRLSKVQFDLPFLGLNWKSAASSRLELSLKNSSFSSESAVGLRNCSHEHIWIWFPVVERHLRP